MVCEQSATRARDYGNQDKQRRPATAVPRTVGESVSSSASVNAESGKSHENENTRDNKRTWDKVGESGPTPDETRGSTIDEQSFELLPCNEIYSTRNHQVPISSLNLSFDAEFTGMDDFNLSPSQITSIPASLPFESSIGMLSSSTEGLDALLTTTPFATVPLDFDLRAFNELESIYQAAPPQPISQQRMDASNVKTDTRAEFEQLLSLGSEAFRRSAMSQFIPTKQHHRRAEQGNLTIFKEDADSPEMHIEPVAKFIPERLSSNSRDQILAMVLETCRGANTFRVVSSFPATDMLDVLLQAALELISREAHSLVHIPTFETNSLPPELLCALIAIGAVSSSLTSVRNFGLALQEAIRMSLEQKVRDMAQAE